MVGVVCSGHGVYSGCVSVCGCGVVCVCVCGCGVVCVCGCGLRVI